MRKGIISKKAIILGITMFFIGAGFLQHTNTTVRADFSEGLVGYWNFNEGSGTIVHDSSEYGNDGTITGATWMNGVSGNALSFDGVNDYVTVPDSNSLDITSDITISVWIKLEAISGTLPIICKGITGPLYSYYMGTGSDYPPCQANLQLYCIDDMHTWLDSDETLTAGNWYHIVGIRSGTTESIYINGLLDNSNACFSGVLKTNDIPLYFGMHDYNTHFFNGLIDEIRIYNRALNANEIHDLFLQDTLVSYWNFNEGTGTIAHDSTENGHDGTIQNGIWVNGVSGKALEFQKTGNVIFDVFELGNVWSVSYWIKLNEYNVDSNAILGYNGNEYVTEIWSNTRKAVTAIGSNYWSESKAMEWTDGSWYHVAILMNHGVATYYINGEEKTYDANFGNSPSPMRIRAIAGHGDPANWLNGVLDEIRVYSRVLNYDEVQELASIELNQPPVADAGGPYYANVNNAVTFDASGSSDPDGTITGYRWDFTNDGTYDTGWLTSATTTHSYQTVGTYTVKLEVKDDDANTSTDTATVTITSEGGAIPTAEANGPYSGYVNNPVSFSSAGSVGGSEGTITSWYWTFGDGTVSSQQNPSHTYTSSGIFVVTLKVTNNYGETNTDTTSATISNISPEQSPPIANAGGPYVGVVGTSITFNGSGSSDADGTIVSYLWNFGDSTTGTGISPTHTYTIPGNYTVILTVTDNESLTHSNSTTVSINVSGPPTIIISVDMSNIEPIVEGNEKTITVTVFCYHQAVSNIHIDFLEWSNLTCNQSSPNINLNPGESGELLIRIKAPMLEKKNNSKIEFSSEKLTFQAVGDDNITSDNETINIIVTPEPPDGIPGFETVATVTAIGSAGALVTFFRRRNRNR